MKLEERLELLKEELQKEDFLKSKGLGNEIPFWIFDYPPEKELLLRDTIIKIISNLEKNSIQVLEIDLFNICLEIIDQKISAEKIIAFEESKGSEELLKKMKLMLKPDILKSAIQQKMNENSGFQIIFLNGVGKAWPIVRSHTILNNLQPLLGNIPLVTFYPGKYSGFDLSLFGKIRDANYYRAFRLINTDNVSQS
ncbi:DUF1788 domain-containing protein [Methanococcoides sp. NM1]|uniref:DUF1788 domain-containing protein n=1 Tax=Methanococcoides sp. NM1 TaxID=1201013 RepID=UPI0010847D84|nr:DUF1788 domain-containing protein [Methanococcoides sp. NM1]